MCAYPIVLLLFAAAAAAVEEELRPLKLPRPMRGPVVAVAIPPAPAAAADVAAVSGVRVAEDDKPRRGVPMGVLIGVTNDDDGAAVSEDDAKAFEVEAVVVVL